MYAHWTCPHCGTVNTIHSASTELRVAWCEVEIGGCDRPIVIDCVVRAHIDVYKIEGLPNLNGGANV